MSVKDEIHAQIAGALSLILSVASMVTIVLDLTVAAEICFSIALVLMLLSLSLLIVEVSISMKALDLQLADLEGGRIESAKD